VNLLLKIKQISLRIFIGVLSGFILGVVARLWMRWISTEPEFSWSGSIFIVSGFVIFATSQSIVGLLRKRFHGKLATFAIRVVGVIFSLPIFAAAGAIMLPTVVLASIAIWRPSLRKSVKSVLLILALYNACKGLCRHSFELRVECCDNRSVTLVCLDLFGRHICDSSNRFGALVTALSSPTSGKAIVDLSSI